MKKIIKRYRNLSREDRTILHTKMAVVFNYLWSLAKIIFGIITKAYIIIASGIFTLLIGRAKHNCLKGIKKESPYEANKKVKTTGIYIMVACFFYGLYMARLLFIKTVPSYGVIPSIGIAAFAFASLSVACAGMFSFRKKSYLLRSIKIINFIIALTDIAIAQMAVLTVQMPNLPQKYNAYLGIGIAVMGMASGLYLVMKAKQFKKYYKKASQE